MLSCGVKLVLCVPSDALQLVYFLEALALLFEVGQLLLKQELLLVEIHALLPHLLTGQIFYVHLILF